MFKCLKMKKLYLLIIVILLSLFFINKVNAAAPPQYCTGVNVCPGSAADTDKYNFYVACNSIQDGFCPENYTKTSWSTCPVVNVGKCYPCDPDCSLCPALSLVITDAVDFNGIVNAIASKPYTHQVNVKVNRAGAPSFGVDSPCGPGDIASNGGICTVIYSDAANPNITAPTGEGGNTYCYEATTVGNEGGDYIMRCGTVRPQVTLSVNTVSMSNNGGINIGNNNNINIESTIHSKVGITGAVIGIYKYSEQYNQFFPINLVTTSPDYCSFRCPPNNVCTSFASYTDPGGTAIDPTDLPIPSVLTGLDGTRCENTKYTINVTAYDNYYQGISGKEANFGVNLVIDNDNPVCTDQCPIFTSKTLQTVLAKIKTWINPS